MGTLQSLRIITESLDADTWAFVEWFAGTLETLELQCLELSTARPPQLGAKFLRFTSLTLRTSHPIGSPLLSFLSTSPLITLRLAFSGDEDIPKSPVTPALSALSPTVRYLRYISEAFTTDGDEETAWLRDFCSGRGIVLARAGQWTAYVLSDTIFTSDAVQGEGFLSFCSSLDEVLAFGADRAAAVRQDGDLQGIKTLVGHTKGLKALQDVWRD